MWLEDLGASGGRELVGLASGPQVVDVQTAVRIEYLAMANADRLAAFAVDGDPEPPRQVLPEIDDYPSHAHSGQRPRREQFGDVDRRPGIGHDCRPIACTGYDPEPS